jgi:hypothetical protein
MINEANSDLTHSEMITWLAGFLHAQDHVVFAEFTLPEGNRADIFIKREDHEIVIIECKADFRPREIARSVLKYSPWCNYLMFALNPVDAQLISQAQIAFMRTSWPVHYGLLSVHRLGYETLVDPPYRQMQYVNQQLVELAIIKRLRR